MTLFSRAQGGDESVFRRALDRFCAGQMDERTLVLLDKGIGEVSGPR